MLTRDDQLKIYIEKGWRLISLYSVVNGGQCSCRNPECPTPGKHPQTGYAKARAYKNTLALKGNVGVMCGDDFVVLDIDPRNGGTQTLAALEATHGALPPTWTVCSGGGGEHRYFAIEGSQACHYGLQEKGVELKGVGSYVVCPSSNHASGREYEWMPDREPEDLPLAPLPEWVLEATRTPENEGGEGIGGASQDRIGESTLYSREEILESFKFIDPDMCGDKTWKNLAMGLAAGGFDFEHFLAISSGEARGKPSVSFAKCKEKGAREAWNSQVRQIAKGNIHYSIGTVIKMAREGGWELKQTTPNPLIWPPVASEEPIPMQEEKTPTTATAIKPEVEWPPGIIGEIAQEIYRISNFKSREFAIASGISTVSMIAQGNYHSPIKKGYLSSYYGLVALPSWGKESYSSLPHKILMKVAKWMICGEPQSPQALRRKLHECNSQAVIEDEILLWIKDIVDLNAPIQKDLLKVWGSSTNFLAGKENKAKGESSPAIHVPRLSIIGGGTLDTFFELIAKKGASLSKNGLMSRFDFLFVTKKETAGREDDDFAIGDELFPKLMAIAGHPICSKEVDTKGEVIGDLIRYEAAKKVIWGEGAKNWYYDMRDEWLLVSYERPLTGSIWNRAAEKVLRIGCLLAITRDHKEPVVGTPDLLWARTWQESVTIAIERILLERVGRCDEVDIKHEILALFSERKATKMTLRELRRFCYPVRGLDHATLTRALDALVAEGWISAGSGRRRDSIEITLLQKTE